MVIEIKTKRIILRPISMSDRDAMVQMIMSDKDVMSWLPYSEATSTVAGQREVAVGYLEDFTKPWEEYGYGVWAICTRDAKLGTPGSFIGYCGFIPGKIDGAGPEIAYALAKSMWGKGLVTEALFYCLDWIFTKHVVPCVHAVTDDNNIASRRVMEKVGMKYEKDVDLYESVAKGYGLLPLYSISRDSFCEMRQLQDLSGINV